MLAAENSRSVETPEELKGMPKAPAGPPPPTFTAPPKRVKTEAKKPEKK
jgi:hypothetical protein